MYNWNSQNFPLYHDSKEFAECNEYAIIQKFIDIEYEHAIFMLCDNGIILIIKSFVVNIQNIQLKQQIL